MAQMKQPLTSLETDTSFEQVSFCATPLRSRGRKFAAFDPEEIEIAEEAFAQTLLQSWAAEEEADAHQTSDDKPNDFVAPREGASPMQVEAPASEPSASLGPHQTKQQETLDCACAVPDLRDEDSVEKSQQIDERFTELLMSTTRGRAMSPGRAAWERLRTPSPEYTRSWECTMGDGADAGTKSGQLPKTPPPRLPPQLPSSVGGFGSVPNHFDTQYWNSYHNSYDLDVQYCSPNHDAVHNQNLFPLPFPVPAQYEATNCEAGQCLNASPTNALPSAVKTSGLMFEGYHHGSGVEHMISPTNSAMKNSKGDFLLSTSPARGGMSLLSTRPPVTSSEQTCHSPLGCQEPEAHCEQSLLQKQAVAQSNLETAGTQQQQARTRILEILRPRQQRQPSHQQQKFMVCKPVGASEDRQFVPSVGSKGHPYTCAGPCKFAHRLGGCRIGADCTHCHICKYDKDDKNKKRAM